jgi:hypothetical protein
MRDVLGMPLAEIRKELLVVSPEQIRAYASRVQGPEQEISFSMRELRSAPLGSSALDYIGAIRARDGATVALPDPGAGQATAPPGLGFEALEHRLAGHPEPARREVVPHPHYTGRPHRPCPLNAGDPDPAGALRRFYSRHSSWEGR